MALSLLRKLLSACALIALAGLPLALLTLGGDRARQAPGLYAGAETAVGKRFARPQASPAHTHSGSLGVAGMSERRLRAFETRVLGPAHAREHALQRRAVCAPRRARRRPLAAPASAPPSASPADVGRWTAAFPIPVMAVHAAVLPTGKVMWFSYPKNPSVRHGGDGPASPNTAQAWLWNPATGQHTRVDPPLWRDPADGQLKPANIWCAGQSFTADGRLVVVGRQPGLSSTERATSRVSTRSTRSIPFNETWTEQPDMRHGRWYPTEMRMPDGRMSIISGLDETGAAAPSFNTDVEMFTPSADMNGRGTISLLGQLRRLGPAADRRLYPHMFSMPSGRGLIGGPVHRRQLVAEHAGLEHVHVAGRPEPARATGSGERPFSCRADRRLDKGDGDRRRRLRHHTSTTTGLAVPPPRCSTRPPSAGWQPAPAMNVGRGHHNTVLLPDGSMVDRRRRRRASATATSGRPTPRRSRSSCGIPPPAVGRLGPAPGREPAPTTRPRCCSPTGASSPRATTCTAASTATRPRSTSRRTYSRAPRPTISDRAGDSPTRHQLRRGHARRERHQGRAGRAERGHPRGGHEPALDPADRRPAPRRRDADGAGQRELAPPGLLHALPRQRPGRPVGREVREARARRQLLRPSRRRRAGRPPHRASRTPTSSPARRSTANSATRWSSAFRTTSGGRSTSAARAR